MGKSVNPDVLDAALDKVATGTEYNVCSDEPTTRTEAITTFSLASETLGGGDFSKANGDVSGRKLTISAKSDIEVDDTGTATHIAISDGTDLLYVTTCTSQALTEGNTVNLSSWKIEIADPS